MSDKRLFCFCCPNKRFKFQKFYKWIVSKRTVREEWWQKSLLWCLLLLLQPHTPPAHFCMSQRVCKSLGWHVWLTPSATSLSEEQHVVMRRKRLLFCQICQINDNVGRIKHYCQSSLVAYTCLVTHLIELHLTIICIIHSFCNYHLYFSDVFVFTNSACSNFQQPGIFFQSKPYKIYFYIIQQQKSC